jgi:hypothetical protein
MRSGTTAGASNGARTKADRSTRRRHSRQGSSRDSGGGRGASARACSGSCRSGRRSARRRPPAGARTPRRQAGKRPRRSSHANWDSQGGRRVANLSRFELVRLVTAVGATEPFRAPLKPPLTPEGGQVGPQPEARARGVGRTWARLSARGSTTRLKSAASARREHLSSADALPYHVACQELRGAVVDRVSTDRERQSKRCSAVGGLSTSPALSMSATIRSRRPAARSSFEILMPDDQLELGVARLVLRRPIPGTCSRLG